VDVSCHSYNCSGEPLPDVQSYTSGWELTGDAVAQSCAAKLFTSCDTCRSAPASDTNRTCYMVNDTANAYSGSDPSCTIDTCPTLSDTYGSWDIYYGPNDDDGVTYGNSATYGTTATASCGTKTTLTCPSCYHVQFANGSGLGPGVTYTRECDSVAGGNTGGAWSGDEASCVEHVAICDANLLDMSTRPNMTAVYNFSNNGSTNSICNDTVTYSCPMCALFTTYAYPDAEADVITRTCQADGTWSGHTELESVECQYADYKYYSTNMLEGNRSNYSLKLSPYECQHNLTLCFECQDHVDAMCRMWSNNAAKRDVCMSIAKNKCPMRCNGDTEICSSCDLTNLGISYCAATGQCMCNTIDGVDYQGDGCQYNVSYTAVAAEDTSVQWPWWSYAIPLVVVGVVLYCMLVCCFQMYYGIHRDAPEFSDVINAGGQGCLHYVWYYYLCGCLCMSPAAAGEQRHMADIKAPNTRYTKSAEYSKNPAGGDATGPGVELKEEDETSKEAAFPPPHVKPASNYSRMCF